VKILSSTKKIIPAKSCVNNPRIATSPDAIGAKAPKEGSSDVKKSSPALSLENMKKTPKTRKVGVLIGNGFNGTDVTSVLDTLKEKGVQPEIVSEKLGNVKGSDGKELGSITHF
jgi:catalase